MPETTVWAVEGTSDPQSADLACGRDHLSYYRIFLQGHGFIHSFCCQTWDFLLCFWRRFGLGWWWELPAGSSVTAKWLSLSCIQELCEAQHCLKARLGLQNSTAQAWLLRLAAVGIAVSSMYNGLQSGPLYYLQNTWGALQALSVFVFLWKICKPC